MPYQAGWTSGRWRRSSWQSHASGDGVVDHTPDGGLTGLVGPGPQQTHRLDTDRVGPSPMTALEPPGVGEPRTSPRG